MGYYTKYDIEAPDHVVEAITLICGYHHGPWEESCKWYDHEDHVRRASRAFPDVLITLRGEGEQSGDLWVKYFRGGRMQKVQARIVFDDFDETKLDHPRKISGDPSEDAELFKSMRAAKEERARRDAEIERLQAEIARLRS